MDMSMVKSMMEDIVSEMRELYLRDNRPWIVLFSTGKDSTLVLLLTWMMLLSIPPEKRHKKIHVVTSDTKVETPSMTKFVLRSLAGIRKTVEEQGLPIEVHLGRPEVKDSFFYQILGKGNTVPTKQSPFRWCTDKLKMTPAEAMVEIIIENSPPTFSVAYVQDDLDKKDVIMVLGVRDSESTSRKQSIQKFTIRDKFARHAKHDRALVYHPIKFVELNELWGFLLSQNKLPWGIRSTELYAMYKDFSGECPMTSVEGKQQKSCGGGRQGCWVCCYVKKDNMMLNLIAAGEKELIPLLEWKEMLGAMRNDIRYREPLRRLAEKNIMKPNEAQQWNLFSQAMEDDQDYQYEHFKRADNWQFLPGPMTLEARRIMFQKLLWAQQESGEKLIEDEEIEAILHCWSDDGYIATEGDLSPVNHQYDGSVVLNPDGSLNAKETTNPNQIFLVWQEFDQSLDDVLKFIRERACSTGQHYFYHMDCTDYHRDFRMEKDDPIVNHAWFVVCKEGVVTQKQANALIEEWLYKRDEADLMDWDQFALRTKASALQLIQEPNFDTQKLDRYNDLLVKLGHEPVIHEQLPEQRIA